MKSEEATNSPAAGPDWSLYYSTCTLKNRASIALRPIRPEDEPLMVEFHRTLSDRTVRFRYFENIDLARRISHERLQSICSIDFKQKIALVAEWINPDTEQREIIGVGRLLRIFPEEAEFAVLVTDRFQGTGLGTHLLNRLIGIARAEKVQKVIGYILPENIGMQAVCRKLGFELEMNHTCKEVEAILEF